MRMAVAAIFPADRAQQPATPMKKNTNTKKNDTMNMAIIALAMSANKPVQFD